MADCGDPLCCRKESGVALLESQKAGRYRLELATDTALDLVSWSLPRMLKAPIHRWGDLRKCDTPLRTIEAMYMHIAAHHTVDLIYWTGDLPPHDIWNQSRDGNVEVRDENVKVMEKSRAINPYFHIICHRVPFSF